MKDLDIQINFKRTKAVDCAVKNLRVEPVNCILLVSMRSLDLPEKIYSDLQDVSQELSLMAKKPVSVSMTVSLLIEVYRAHLSNPCALDGFSQQLRNSDVLSPEEFDKMWDEDIEAKKDLQETKRKKGKRKV